MSKRAQQIQAPPWRNSAIIAAAARLGKRFEDIVGREHIAKNGLRFDELYEKLLYPKFSVELYEGIDLGVASDGRKILGSFNILENTACVDLILEPSKKDPRRVFTLYHEVAGHGVLQGKWLRKQLCNAAILSTDMSISSQAELRIERQANLFASYLAAPEWLIHYAIMKVFEPTRPFLFLGPCQYCLASNGWSDKKEVTDVYDLCRWIGSKVSQYFGGLSGEAIGYRIAETKWIDDRTDSLGRRSPNFFQQAYSEIPFKDERRNRLRRSREGDRMRVSK
jgi:hypothetical protein